MIDAFICDAVRTPIGRYAGSLADVRTDDLGAVPIRALMARNPGVDWSRVDDVWYGCANQAGEDNRNVARMSSLLAGLPVDVPGVTVNRLCGSGMEAVGSAARAIKAGEIELAIAGGVESMSRAPFVHGQGDCGFQPRCANLRHHDRLALRQQIDEGPVRCRFHARDGGERGAAVRHQPGGPGRLRPAQPAARRRRPTRRGGSTGKSCR